MEIKMTSALRTQVQQLEEEYQAAYDAIAHHLSGWARTGAREGLRNRWFIQLAWAAFPGYGEDDIASIGEQVLGAAHAFDEPADGDYGRG